MNVGCAVIVITMHVHNDVNIYAGANGNCKNPLHFFSLFLLVGG